MSAGVSRDIGQCRLDVQTDTGKGQAFGCNPAAYISVGLQGVRIVLEVKPVAVLAWHKQPSDNRDVVGVQKPNDGRTLGGEIGQGERDVVVLLSKECDDIVTSEEVMELARCELTEKDDVRGTVRRVDRQFPPGQAVLCDIAGFRANNVQKAGLTAHHRQKDQHRPHDQSYGDLL